MSYSRLDLTAPTRYMGSRKLLKEGILAKSKSGRKLRAFLCSDILVLTDEGGKQLYRLVSSLILLFSQLALCSSHSSRSPSGKSR